MEPDLPENLTKNLKKARLRALQVLLLTTVFAAVALFGGSLLLLYISDRFWATPNVVRLIILISTLTVFLAFLFRHFRSSRSLKKNRNTVIKLVQRYFPNLGDSLQGAVELSSGEHKGMSESLCTAAVKQVADQTEGMDFTEAVSTKRRNKAFKYFAAAAAVIILCTTIDYKALLNTAERWAMPLANIDRYTFINIAEMKDTHYVEHGKDFELPVFIDKDSRFSVSTLKYQFKGTSLKEAEIIDNKAVLKLKGQTKPTELNLYAGDSDRTIKIIPVLPPAIVNMKYKIDYPAYLKKQAYEDDLKGTQLEILEGSEFSMAAKTSSVLSKASLIRVEVNDEGDETARTEPQALKVADKNFSTETLNKGDRYIFSWRDTHNFKNRKDRDISINFVKDLEPFADLPTTEKNNYVLYDRNYPVNIHCEDDYGLQAIGIEYRIESEAGKGKWIQTVIRHGQSDSKTLSALYILNAEKLGAVEGTTIHVRAIAKDFLPNRKWCTSAEYTFSVISKEEHAQMVHDKIKEISGKIEDAIIREESNKNKNTVLSQQDAEKIDSESTDSAIDNSLNAELANSQDLKDLAQAGKEAIDMAKENSLFDKDELAKLEKSMESVEKVAENMMPKASEKLEDAAKSQGTEGKPGEGKPGEGKPGEGKPGEGKPGEGKPGEGKPGEGKPGEGKPGEGKPGEGKPGEGKPGEGKPGEGKPGEGKPGEGKPGEGKPGESQTGPQLPQNGESRQANLEDAVEEQERILEELRKANKGAKEASKNAELKIMAQRLKKLAELERVVASDAGDVFTMAPGLSPEKLRNVVQSMLQGTSANQGRINTELSSLKREIYNFYDKTQFEEYNKVHTDMEDVNVMEGVETLVHFLDKNQTFTSNTHAIKWADKFDEWAKWLSKEDEGDESESEESEPQEGEQELDEFLAKLFDIIYNEQTLREDTQDAYNKKNLKNYRERTTKLAEQQGKIGKDLADLIPEAPPNIQPYLTKAGEFMLEAKKELGEKHDAGQNAINAESAAIEILIKAFEQGAGQ